MTVKVTDQIQKGEMVELKYYIFTPSQGRIHLIDYSSIYPSLLELGATYVDSRSFPPSHFSFPKKKLRMG